MTKLARTALRGWACAAILAFPLLRGDETPLRLDASASKVEFQLSSVLHTVHGEFQLKEGTLHFDPSTGGISGQVIVDARSGQSGNGSRDGRMHREILESQRYPDIAFHPDRIEGTVAPAGVSPVKIHGQFSIHGGAHEVSVPAEIRATAGVYDVTAHFDVPYVKWGLKNPSTFILRVSDTAQISLHTLFR